jgi:hypothetical protein
VQLIVDGLTVNSRQKKKKESLKKKDKLPECTTGWVKSRKQGKRRRTLPVKQHSMMFTCVRLTVAGPI